MKRAVITNLGNKARASRLPAQVEVQIGQRDSATMPVPCYWTAQAGLKHLQVASQVRPATTSLLRLAWCTGGRVDMVVKYLGYTVYRAGLVALQSKPDIQP